MGTTLVSINRPKCKADARKTGCFDKRYGQCQWNIYIAPIVEGRIWGAGVWVTTRWWLELSWRYCTDWQLNTVTLEQYSVSVWNVDSLLDIFSVKIAMGMGTKTVGMGMACVGMVWGWMFIPVSIFSFCTLFTLSLSTVRLGSAQVNYVVIKYNTIQLELIATVW